MRAAQVQISRNRAGHFNALLKIRDNLASVARSRDEPPPKGGVRTVQVCVQLRSGEDLGVGQVGEAWQVEDELQATPNTPSNPPNCPPGRTPGFTFFFWPEASGLGFRTHPKSLVIASTTSGSAKRHARVVRFSSKCRALSVSCLPAELPTAFPITELEIFPSKSRSKGTQGMFLAQARSGAADTIRRHTHVM